MKRMRLLILATAIVAALLAAYLAAGLMRRPAATPAAPVAEKTDTVDVLTAARNLAPGDRLDLQWRSWPRDSVSPDVITRETMPDATTSLATARALAPLIAGEPVLAAKVIRGAETGFMSALLPEGRRAIAIQISDLSSAGGFVLPNDRVDVIFTKITTDFNGNKSSVSDAVLTNVKVLAINQTVASATDSASIPDAKIAVLELTQRQAEVLARISAGGQLSLALRSIEDKGNGQPALAEAYRNPNRASGALVVRYGLERQTK